MAIENPINKFNVLKLPSGQVKVFAEDLENIFKQIEVLSKSLLGIDENKYFHILAGFNDNGDGTFSGGTLSVDGQIYWIDPIISILSGSYLRPTTDVLKLRTESLNNPYYAYEIYTAVIDNSHTTLSNGKPNFQINSQNIYDRRVRVHTNEM
jgi:hypothetical protein